MNRPGSLALFLSLTAALTLAAQNGSGDLAYPTILRLAAGDASFMQYQADVADARQRLANLEQARLDAPRAAAGLTVYAYRPQQADEFFTLAARCGIPYAGLASANRLPNPDLLGRATVLLLPSVPGIYIPEPPLSDLERLMTATRAGKPAVEILLRPDGKPQRFRFFPGDDFSPTERAFFLNAAFRFPLPAFTLTSAYGLRRNPVTGNLVFHQGLDLAAPPGTDVYATRDGTVDEIGDDPIYGKYVVIRHEGDWSSLYGHLSEVLTDLRKPVRSGTLIGRVGSTGQSTGPHLHFELRQDGRSRNPAPLLPSKGTDR
jgi:murein DD-endopeptidase MepM/ murein hydrolase activator NlpD